MSDLQQYIIQRKAQDQAFNDDFDCGYQSFKISAMLRQVREASGLTQEEVAQRLKLKKSVIAQMENHAENMRLSMLEKLVASLGKKLEISIY